MLETLTSDIRYAVAFRDSIKKDEGCRSWGSLPPGTTELIFLLRSLPKTKKIGYNFFLKFFFLEIFYVSTIFFPWNHLERMQKNLERNFVFAPILMTNKFHTFQQNLRKTNIVIFFFKNIFLIIFSGEFFFSFSKNILKRM